MAQIKSVQERYKIILEKKMQAYAKELESELLSIGLRKGNISDIKAVKSDNSNIPFRSDYRPDKIPTPANIGQVSSMLGGATTAVAFPGSLVGSASIADRFSNIGGKLAGISKKLGIAAALAGTIGSSGVALKAYDSHLSASLLQPLTPAQVYAAKEAGKINKESVQRAKDFAYSNPEAAKGGTWNLFGEETPLYKSLTNYIDDMAGGYNVVAAHGAGSGGYVRNGYMSSEVTEGSNMVVGTKESGRSLGEMLIGDKNFDKALPIKLLACNMGSKHAKDFSQDLANTTGVPVISSARSTLFSKKGFAGFVDQTVVPGDQEDWVKVYYPAGTSKNDFKIPFEEFNKKAKESENLLESVKDKNIFERIKEKRAYIQKNSEDK